MTSTREALAGSHAFVDLETTGADPAHDRIIEVAVLAVDDGRLVDEWHSLVRPGTRIPPSIEALTGIDDAMVAEAPTFAQLRDELLERLRGRTLVAHNARFDYGFLRNAFRREGVTLRLPVVCTLRLARRLYPRLPRHGLDHLVRHFSIECPDRHRALGDTRAAFAFVQRAAEELGAGAVAGAMARQRQAPALPAGLRDGALDALPDGPGVYLFYGADDVLLYVGKSNDLQRRVRDHFNGDHRTRRAAELARATEHVDWIETAGELGALLREAELVKRCQPLHNRRLRARGDHAIITLQEAASGYLEAQVEPATSPDAWPGDQWYGPFGDRRAARRYLRDLADEHGLCPRLLGLERGRGRRPCFARQLGRCHGACTGEESGPAFNLRLLEAMGPRRIRPWPWPGPVAVAERHPAASGPEETHVVDRWRYLGSARSEEEVARLAHEGRDAPFDRDHYRLLRRWLERHPRAARPLARPEDRQGVLL